MPHVAFISCVGLRVRAAEVLELGMSLPSLRERGEAIGALPALGLLTLAGMTPSSWTRSWHEAGIKSQRETIAELLKKRPQLAAISALTASIDEAYSLAAALRQAGVTVAMGGLHVTARPNEASEHCDAIVIGDGEPVWPALLADAAAGALKRRYQSERPFDLAAAPVPDFALAQKPRRKRPRFTLQTQRGCPFACEFCGASRLLGPFREKPVANIRRELAAINALDRRPLIELADDNTFAGGRDPAALLDALGEARAHFFTEVDWRVGERPELLVELARAGCVQLLVGLESLVFRHPGMGSKDADWARMLRACEAIQERGIAVNACFIVGADGETKASLARLADFIESAPFAEIQLTLQTPFPGTALYRRLEQEGRLLDERGWRCHTLFDLTYRPDAMSVAELERGFRDLLALVFAPEAAARRHSLRRQIQRKRIRQRQGQM